MDNSGIHLANAPFEFKKCEYWNSSNVHCCDFPNWFTSILA
jgi:hypothetical protein